MGTLDAALRQFEATEANLEKLNKLWDQISSQIPSSPAFGTAAFRLTLRDPLLLRLFIQQHVHVGIWHSCGDGYRSANAVSGFSLIACGLCPAVVALEPHLQSLSSA
jgi:hypothetical protein